MYVVKEVFKEVFKYLYLHVKDLTLAETHEIITKIYQKVLVNSSLGSVP